jgi:enoyl-CoA hydratase/carnithine racemase
MDAFISPCPQILVEQPGQVLTLRFNRPERKNALSLAMYTALADAIAHADHNPDIRALLLTGSGENFTSGNDLLDFMNEPEIHEQHPVVRFMRALQGCTKPVVASVRGSAIGIGTTMLFHCDMIYAADNARFQLPFVNLGLCPEYAASYLLPRLIGHARASELLLLGESFDANQALNLGIINAVMADSELDSLVTKRLQRLTAQPPAALRRTKALLKLGEKSGIEAALAAEFLGFAEGLHSEECKEAVTAFFEKRAADFSRFC